MASGSFLSEVGKVFETIGKDALKALGFVASNSPAIANVISLADPALAPEAQIIGQAIGSFSAPIGAAEAAYAAAGKDKAGAQKLADVLPATAQLVEQAMTKANLVKVDDALFSQAINELTQGSVDLWNSIGKSPTAPPDAPPAA